MQPETAWFGEKLTPMVKGFFIHLEAKGCSKCTLVDYRTGLLHYGGWLEESGKYPLGATPQDVKAFLSWLRAQTSRLGKPYSPKSILNTYVALRSFYRWAAEELDATNPMPHVPQPKAQAPVVRVLDREQVEAVLKAAQYTRDARTVGRRAFVMKRPTALRDTSIVLLLLDSGLRASELTGLRVGDVDLATGRLIVQKGKGGKGRLGYFGRTTRKALWKYLATRPEARESDPLFEAAGGRPLTPDALQGLIRGLGARAGICGLHPHQLRHTYATTMLQNGANLFALQQLLGHSSLSSTQRYAQLAQIDLANAHESNSPADRWRL